MLQAGSIRVKKAIIHGPLRTNLPPAPANSFQRIIQNGVVNFNGATRSSGDHNNPRIVSGHHRFRSNSDSSDSDNDSSDSDSDDDDDEMPGLYQPGYGSDSEEDSDDDDWDNSNDDNKMPGIDDRDDEDEDEDEDKDEDEDEDEDEDGEESDEEEYAAYLGKPLSEFRGADVSPVKEGSMLSYGLSLVGFHRARQNVSTGTNMKRFVSFYGVEPKTIVALFDDLKAKFPVFVEKLALMSINWLKSYDTERVLAGRWEYTERTIERKVKEYVRRIQSLKDKKIRFSGFDKRFNFQIGVDGQNYHVNEFRLTPDSKWYEHKSNSCGLKYEYAVHLWTSSVVSMRGPFVASIHDMNVFRGGDRDDKSNWDRESLYFKMPPGMRAVGDSGYGGEPDKITVSKSEHSKEMREFLARAKNREESLHSRFSSFGVLKERFRHGKGTQNKMDLHQSCAEAVCVIVQYDFENGHPLFEI
jgi:hypothetical protein